MRTRRATEAATGDYRLSANGDFVTEGFCVHCSTWKDLTTDHFYFRASRHTFDGRCKSCYSVYQQERRASGAGNRAARRAAEGRRFGLELEFIGSQYDLEREMRSRGLLCNVESYNHRVSRTTWKIVPDGSVSGGAELVSPILRGESGREQIEKASEALKAAGCTVNRATGLHVHHEVTDLPVEAFKLLFHNWANAQDATDRLVAPSRREARNGYCRPLTEWDLDRIDSLQSMDRARVRYAVSGDRYRTLNVQSYGKYGTVEVRQHQGTIDGDKIWNWVRYAQAHIDAAVAGVRIEDDLPNRDVDSGARGLLDVLRDSGGLEQGTVDYLNARVAILDRRERTYAGSG
jgi:hypothetical protein